MLTLTQGHLTLFETCPRKYQLVCFDSLSGLSDPLQHDKTQWGSQFHLLMQQQALDLPVSPLAEANSEMAASLQALAQAAPDVFAHLPVSQAQPETNGSEAETKSTFSQSEHRRRLAFDDYLLTVIYDLVVVSDGAGNSSNTGQKTNQRTGRIYDWKTHQKPPAKAKIKHDWQTRLYLFVLCETTALSAQDVSMTYWFVRPESASDSSHQQPTKPSAYTFGYSVQAHEQTRQELRSLTTQLSQMRAAAHFPKVSIASGKCDQCMFRVRCDRALPNSPLQQDPNRLLKAASQFTADTVEEISM